MNKPHLTECCGQHFCQQCLLHWAKMANGKTCPHCREGSFSHVHDKHLDRSIRELDIRCPNASHGCEWVGHLTDLVSHLDSNSENGCKHHLVECPLKCGELYERRLTYDHTLSTCVQRQICCPHCGTKFKKFLLESHLTKCDRVPVDCYQGCGEKVPQCDMEHHMKTTCAKTIVPCPFWSVGCKHEVRQDELEDHAQVCKDKFMVKAYQKMLSQMEELKQEAEFLRAENKTLGMKVNCLRDGLRQCYSNTDILKRQSENFKSVVLTELEFLHAPCKPCEILSIECLRTGVESQLVHLSSAGNCATYRMPNYSVYKETGKVWHSSPFYIGKGCCFCLAVHVNGIGAGKGTHVSVYLQQEAGLFDTELLWPVTFQQNLEIKLMCQESPKKSMFGGGSSTSTRNRPVSPRSGNRLSPTLPANTSWTESLLANTTTEEFRHHTKSHLSEGDPTPPSSPIIPRHATHSTLPAICEAECQVMTVSKRLDQPPVGTFPSGDVVEKIELFCMQKTCNNIVFLDSMILKVCLPLENGSTSLAGGFNDVGWAMWDSSKK